MRKLFTGVTIATGLVAAATGVALPSAANAHPRGYYGGGYGYHDGYGRGWRGDRGWRRGGWDRGWRRDGWDRSRWAGRGWDRPRRHWNNSYRGYYGYNPGYGW